MTTESPVFGLRALRPLRVRISKVPSPRNSMILSPRSPVLIWSKNRSMILWMFFLLTLTRGKIFSTISALESFSRATAPIQLGFQTAEQVRHPGLLAGGGVPVIDALRDGLVEE